jgi:2,4-dienoyl-CoA reductase-like NADH-dependent reductase (Old Yellow Enzyme family)
MIKKEANIQTAAVGLIRSGYDGEKVLEGADIALVAREFLRNSSFVQHAAQDLEIDAHWPKQYSWAVNKARRHNKEKIQVE